MQRMRWQRQQADDSDQIVLPPAGQRSDRAAPCRPAIGSCCPLLAIGGLIVLPPTDKTALNIYWHNDNIGTRQNLRASYRWEFTSFVVDVHGYMALVHWVTVPHHTMFIELAGTLGHHGPSYCIDQTCWYTGSSCPIIPCWSNSLVHWVIVPQYTALIEVTGTLGHRNITSAVMPSHSIPGVFIWFYPPKSAVWLLLTESMI